MRHRDEPTLERERELGRIEAALDSATAGEGRVVVIEGRAGIGKTRLLQETHALAKGRGFGRVRAFGDALEGAMAWGVVRQLVEPSISRHDRENLGGPAVAALRALDAAAGDPSEAELARTLHALWWVAVDFSSVRPLLMTVDDAHWADPSSLRFLVYLSRRIADLPIVLVVATRPPTGNTGPLVLLSLSRQAERVLPKALSPEALAELMAARGVLPAWAVVTSLHEASGGNPFLARVLVDELDALGLPLDTGATATEIEKLGPSAVFRTVLGRLPDDAVSLAGAIAILGTGGDPWQAGALAKLDVAGLSAAAEALISAHVLTTDGDQLVFVHPVVREAVLTGLGPIARAALHGGAAKALCAAKAPADRVAAHLAQAPRGTLPGSAGILREAAATLLSAGDPRTAAAHLRRAVEESPDDAALRAELGHALLRTGEAVEARRQLLVAADGVPDAELVAAAASATTVVDGPEAAVTELREAIAARPGGPRDPGRMHLEARLAVIRSFLPHHRRTASDHLSAYASLSGGTPDERTLLGLLAQMGRYEVRPADEVAATASRALANGAYFEDATGSIDVMVGWVVAMLALISADGIDEAGWEIERARQRVREHGSPVEFAMVANAALFLDWRLGDLSVMEAEAEGALAAIGAEEPSPQVIAMRATATHFLSYAALERGDLEGAAEVLARFDGDHGDGPSMMPTMWLHEPRALIALAVGNPVLARTQAFLQRDEMRAVGVDPPTIPWRVPAVRAALQLGESDHALQLAEEQVIIARKWGTTTEIGAALRLLAHADGDRRLDLLTESVGVLERSPARLHLARSLVDLGEATRGTDARAPLNRGIELAAECGSAVLRTRAAAALEALGDRPRRTVLADPSSLTASERRVADLAASGRANREIAQELFVTPKAVENHLRRIYTKLGIAGRRGLARAEFRMRERRRRT
ncbi:ATP-binding protein [Amycolatopsis thailandensis]|uniref:ATP-binding protein n=1 Tax=Amycolatopsis thailandensis TaxID=589330 RepID=UPI0036274360